MLSKELAKDILIKTLKIGAYWLGTIVLAVLVSEELSVLVSEYVTDVAFLGIINVALGAAVNLVKAWLAARQAI